MTRLYKEKVECAVCGAETEHTGIRSTNALGSPDLDTRPPRMQRSTMFMWVQRCPECGYCAQNVSKATPQDALVVRSPEYARQLADSTYPELAKSFLCKALIYERSEYYAKAAWALIHSAWACDDAKKDDLAKKCRINALCMIRKALECGQKIAVQYGSDTAIQVDLLRRVGRFNEAQQLIQAHKHKIKEEVILKVLGFQETLITSNDEACHTISEAFGENERSISQCFR